MEKTIIKIKQRYASPIYNNNIENVADDTLMLTINDQIFLDVLFMEIRGISISHSSYRKKENDKREKQLMSELELLETDNRWASNINTYKTCKQELENIKLKMKGHMIRSKVTWLDEGEKPSRYFCSLEAQHYMNKTIFKIENEDGHIITEQNQILKEIENFYQKLYSDHSHFCLDVDLEAILHGYNYNKITNDQKAALEGE